MSGLIRISLVVVLVGLVGSSHAGIYGGGSGTHHDPYQIWTAEQMNAIGADPCDWDKHFMLMADIDLSSFDGQNGRHRLHKYLQEAFPGRVFL